MAEVILTLNKEIDLKVEADVITPDEFAGKGNAEIKQLLVWQGPTQFPLSDFFDVEGDGGNSAEDTSIVINGDTSRVKLIGAKMTAGKITVKGSTGMHVGSEMAGGEIVVEGDADSWPGMEMTGGVLHIKGNAGDHVGSAYRGSWHGMKGGRLMVDGNARSQIGGGMEGGEIIIGGSIENFCGLHQTGGLIVVKGDAIRAVGAEMSGGTIVVGGHILKFTPGMQADGEESNLEFGDVACDGTFKKFVGDYAIAKKPKGILYAGKETNPDL
ncbi:formylmethanofuran dehydrogenase subunit C [Methanohalophilus levihalophilus]|uniref:formylmethanofuran dehydrogenase subunit C n=1 Tax=Methanohalophilus levihalophilus TaxID=1431282 RepID=UPI001AEA7D6D|nr:formylmethanofuran dehydrogenase subunit C [Methanohalophilus levihalophilus]MBP2029702.1 formylmethanofuran dehydrogenase subunit C [Methanohalophilus levihalophilus]